jgi:hypothetical protein
VYYRLHVDLNGMRQYWEALNNQHVVPILGQLLSVEKEVIELPFKFRVKFSQGIDDPGKKQPLYDFMPNRRVMHKRLVGAILSTGVDNLQTFPAEVLDADSGALSREYLVVNVIGLISCANRDESRSHPLGNVQFFEELVLDQPRTAGALMFRLAESPIEIVVHEKVADAIRTGNFHGVVLDRLMETAES